MKRYLMNMAPSNLIPTPIVDKNGVVSIRHKRPEGAGKSQSASLPAPALSPAKTFPTPARSRMAASLRSVCDDKDFHSDFPDYDLLMSRLEDYPESTVMAFDKLIARSGREGDHYERSLASCLQNDMDGNIASYVGHIIGYCEAQGDWADEYHADYSYVDAVRVYRGLKTVQEECGFEIAENLYDSEENLRRFHGLLEVSIAMYNDALTGDVEISDVVEWVSEKNAGGIPLDYDKGWYLKSRLTLSYVAERPEDAGMLVRWFYDRGVIKDEILKQMLESEAPALNDGLL